MIAMIYWAYLCPRRSILFKSSHNPKIHEQLSADVKQNDLIAAYVIDEAWPEHQLGEKSANWEIQTSPRMIVAHHSHDPGASSCASPFLLPVRGVTSSPWLL
jgi:hypothetical protein